VRALVAVGVAAALGCGGGTVQPVTPVGGASAVAAAFMRAVADSNFTQMGAL
jgi:hypothetical protein